MAEDLVTEDLAVEEVRTRLTSYEGLPAVVGGTGRDPVNAPMIRHWCEALGDTHPAYTGPDATAPPTMLQVWTMGGLPGPPPRSPAYTELLALLDELGCTAVVATDCEQEYVRPLRPGDEITFDMVIESVSDRKTTKLGTGYFVTTRTDVRVVGVAGGAARGVAGGAGELAGTHRFRIFKYAPGQRRSNREPELRPRPVVNRDNAGFWEGVARHELLLQRCTGCGALRFPWLPGCRACGSPDWETVAAGGEGTVYSYVVMHHPPFPAFAPPYAVALVQLAEGVRMVANVTGVPYDKVRIGMAVRLEFARYDEELLLPVWRAGAEGAGAERAEGAAAQAAGVPLAPGTDLLPSLEVGITRTLIVAGAIASRDYQDVHHDPEAARVKGSPDVFMNILTTNGLVGRYITDHFGPTAVLRRVAIRLGVPNYPGDTMVLTGRVEETDGADGTTATVRVTGTNGRGRHVTGTVTVTVAAEPTGASSDADGDADWDRDGGTGGTADGDTDAAVDGEVR
ncbi:protein of unknown function DUF35 [Actinobacteria bacterium OK074]|nr:protein of unknown function DUF35 [Actinobacteria bacterium OK074]